MPIFDEAAESPINRPRAFGTRVAELYLRLGSGFRHHFVKIATCDRSGLWIAPSSFAFPLGLGLWKYTPDAIGRSRTRNPSLENQPSIRTYTGQLELLGPCEFLSRTVSAGSLPTALGYMSCPGSGCVLPEHCAVCSASALVGHVSVSLYRESSAMDASVDR
jgi:hypothetical protein